VTDWANAASLATAGGTLVLAVATFASIRSANRSARMAERAARIAERSRTVSATRMRASHRTASAIASDGRQSISTSLPARCMNRLPWKIPPPLSSDTRSFTTIRVTSAPSFVTMSIIRSWVSGRSLAMPAMRVAMLCA